MTHYRLFPLFPLLLAACSPPAATDTPPEASGEVRALVRQTLANLVFVEGGSFMMGDVGTYITRESYDQIGNFEFVDADHPESMFLRWTTGPYSEDNKPAHEVTLSGYSLARHETTYGEYDVFTQATGREPIRPELVERGVRSPDHPVPVNWHQARDYCLWLGEQTGLPFDLPTEAQWEYAARSRGRNVLLATDDGWLDVGRNYPSPGGGPKPVGSFPPNSLGLHDMSGNVEEWVFDRYSATYYARGANVDPDGPGEGKARVIRGGFYGRVLRRMPMCLPERMRLPILSRDW